MPPPSRRLNDKSLNQILTASKSSLVTAGEISNTNIMGDYRRQLQVINTILSGVEYLHLEGVFHRDLKPANILYNSDTDIAITDFGLGIQVDSGSATLTRNMVFGTDRYMSPEQKTDSHNVDQRTDIYALGMILEDIVTNFSQNEDYDNSIKYIIDKCTKRRKEDRYSSVTELRKQITDVYNILLGIAEQTTLEQDLAKLSRKEIDDQDLVPLAMRIQAEKDDELIDRFLGAISTDEYVYIETSNEGIAENLVRRICSYWNRTGWPFSYIDIIADTTRKLFIKSKNADIKAEMLHRLMDLAIYYNRWYAMGVAGDLLDGIKNDYSVQIALQNYLKQEWVDIKKIKEENKLPQLIKDLYEEREK